MSKQEENKTNTNPNLSTIEQLQDYLSGKPIAPEHTEIIADLMNEKELLSRKKENREDPHLPFITNFPNQATANYFNQIWSLMVDGFKSVLFFDLLTRDLKLFTAVGGARAQLIADTTQPKVIIGKTFDPNTNDTK